MNRPGTALVMVRREQDPFGTHELFSRAFAHEYRKRGYRVLILDPADTKQVSEAARLMAAGRIAFVHCEQAHGIACQAGLADGVRINLFQLYGVPAFAHLRDYPFCFWVRRKLLGTSPAVTVFHVDERAPELARQMGSPARHAFLPHAYLDPDGEPRSGSGSRPIRLLYVGAYQPPGSFRDHYLAETGEPAILFDRCVEAAIDDFHVPIWETVAAVCGELGHPCDLADGKAQNLTFMVNQFIRFERRRRLFAALCGRPEAVIVWAGEPPANSPPIRARVLGKTRFDQTLTLMDQAETMVMVLNNFSHGLSERLLSAMHRGCCVITHPNSLIDRTFRHARELLRADPDLANLDALIEQAADPLQRSPIVSAAQQRVDEAFSVSSHVETIFGHLQI